MVYAANCCRLNYENFTIIVFIILTQCGLLRVVICSPIALNHADLFYPYDHDPNKSLASTTTSTSATSNVLLAQFQNNYRYNYSHENDSVNTQTTTTTGDNDDDDANDDENHLGDNDRHQEGKEKIGAVYSIRSQNDLNSDVLARNKSSNTTTSKHHHRPHHPSHNNNSKISSKNGVGHFKKKNKSSLHNINATNENENQSIIVDLEFKLINLINEFFRTTSHENASSTSSSEENSKHPKNMSTTKQQSKSMLEMLEKHDVENSTSLKENVNRIIHNSIVEITGGGGYMDHELVNNYAVNYHDLQPQLTSNEISSTSTESIDDFDIMNNSIENDDFYFTSSYTTTATTSTTTTEMSGPNNEWSKEGDDDNSSSETTPSSDAVTTPPSSREEEETTETITSTTTTETTTTEEDESTLTTTTEEQQLTETTTTTASLNLNYTIPFHIPFQFNDSSLPQVDSSTRSSDIPADNTTNESSTTLYVQSTMMTTTDNLVDDDNTEAIMSIPEATTASEILPSLSSTSPSQISESTSNDSSLSTSHYYSEPITLIIETTTAEISITSSTLEQQTISGGEDLPIATTTFLPVDYSNTTKSIPYPDNPIFLECISSCGTDHDCVRTKCLLDSTYFG